MARPRLTPPDEINTTDTLSLRRFDLADFTEMGAWLLKELAPRYPALNERSIYGWLRGLIGSSEYLFIRSDHAVGLAQRQHHPLNADNVIEGLFVLTQPGHDGERGAFYREFYRWSLSLGATELAIDGYSDVSRETLKGIGRIFIREVAFVRIAHHVQRAPAPEAA